MRDVVDHEPLELALVPDDGAVKELASKGAEGDPVVSPGDVSPVHRTRFVRVVVSESRRGMEMPFAYSAEFRSMVVEQMRDGRSVAGLARELEMHESTLHRWKRQDRVDRGLISGVGTAESARLREARRRIRELEAELAAAKRAFGAVRGGARGAGGAPKRDLPDRGGLGS